MSAQSVLLLNGARSSTLGAANNLAIAFPLSAGAIGMDAHTDATRTGFYAVAATKIGHVVNGTEVLSVGATTVTANVPLSTPASIAGAAGINIGQGVAPTVPNNGDVWITAAGMFCRANGATVGPFSAGGGTVTSVGLALPAIFTVSGSPVTTSGTLTGTLATQNANLVFAGPSSGGAATPTFRALVTADLPAGTGTIGGSIASTQVAVGSGVNTISGSSSLTFTGGVLSVTGAINATGNIATGASYPTNYVALVPTDGSLDVSSDTSVHINGVGYKVSGGADTNDMVFWTYAAGGHAATEVMRIVNGGSITGHLQMVASTANTTSFNIQQGTAPTVPNNGDVWMTSAGMWCQAGGITIGPFGAGTGTVTGSGSAGQLTYWSGASAITGNADFTVSTSAGVHLSLAGATNEMLGTNAGNNTLTGTNNVVIGGSAGHALTGGGFSVFVGYQAGNALLGANGNVFVGYQAGMNDTAGGQNVAVGNGAGFNMQGSNNTYMGQAAGQGAGAGTATGTQNVAIGQGAYTAYTSGGSNTIVGSASGAAITSGSTCTLVGYSAGAGLVSNSDSTCIGANAGLVLTAAQTTLVGSGAGKAITSGAGNNAFGYNALLTASTATNNSAFGLLALTLATSNQNSAFGANALKTLAANGDCTAVGYNALTLATGAQNTAVGSQAGAAISSGATNTMVGYLAGNAISTNSDSTCVGASAGKVLTAAGTTFVGSGAGVATTSGTGNTAVGYQALASNVTNASNTAVGYQALTTSTSNDNTACGYMALTAVGSGSQNTGFGSHAAPNLSNGLGCVAVGYSALNSLTGNSDCTAVGANALSAATGGGNTAIGSSAGTVTTTGTFNIFLGRNSGDSTANNASNRLVAGGNNAAISDVYMGNGETNAAPQNLVHHATGGNGTNISGANYTIAAGIPTGSGVGGSFIVQTAPAAGSSSTPGTLATQFTVDSLGNVVPGNAALATSATNGWLYIESCAGVPTGVPAGSYTGRIPLVINSSTNTIYGYNGSWVALAGSAITGAGSSGQICFYSGASTINGNADFTMSTSTGVHLSLSGASNEMLGSSAGNSTLTSTNCAMFGNSAGAALTNGGNNAFFGYKAGQHVTSGASITAVGYFACNQISTNNNQTGVGYQALYQNGGADNTAVGYNALAGTGSNGAQNTAVGSGAGAAVTSGTTSVYIGYQAGNVATIDTGNTIIGAGAGILVLGANNITAIGRNAGATITSGSPNIFIGYNAGDSTSATAVGHCVIGGAGTTAGITDFYIGRGEALAAPGTSITIHASGGSGTDISGADMIIAGGIPTGAGVGGHVYIQTAPAAGSGTTAGTLANRLTIDQKGNVVPGTAALATNATDGFLYLQSCAGAPSGVPTSYTGRVACIVDTSTGTGKFWAYVGGTWRGVALT